MKKELFVTILSFFLLTACGQSSQSQNSSGGIKNKEGIYSSSVCDSEPIELKAQNVEYMINNKYSFHLLTYTEECSYCSKAKQNTEEITKWSRFAIYQIEMYEGSIAYLSNAFPDYFMVSDTYPSLLTFKEGQLTFTAQTEDITDLSSFKRYITANTYKTNINTVTTIDGYDTLKNLSDCYLVYIFNSDDKNGKDIFYNHIFQKACKSVYQTIFIDISLAKTELIKQILLDFNLSEDEDIDILSVHKNDNKTTLRYSVESDLNIDNLLASFFNPDSI